MYLTDFCSRNAAVNRQVVLFQEIGRYRGMICHTLDVNSVIEFVRILHKLALSCFQAIQGHRLDLGHCVCIIDMKMKDQAQLCSILLRKDFLKFKLHLLQNPPQCFFLGRV